MPQLQGPMKVFTLVRNKDKKYPKLLALVRSPSLLKIKPNKKEKLWKSWKESPQELATMMTLILESNLKSWNLMIPFQVEFQEKLLSIVRKNNMLHST